MVLERGGIHFGLFGIMGLDSIQFTINPGALIFPNPTETARAVAKQLRAEGADVIQALRLDQPLSRDRTVRPDRSTV